MAKMRSAPARIVVEGLIVSALGAALAFGANALSPHGLALNRNYFPTGSAVATKTNRPPIYPGVSGAGSNSLSTTSNAAPTPAVAKDATALRLEGKGLVWLSREDLEKWLTQTGVVFVDARDDEKFASGHLAGALQLDPYHPEKSFGPVLARCMTAEKVVVYCAGGECEDADTVALMLRDAGVPPDRIYVYGGGMNEWSALHKPLETGEAR